MAVFGNHDTFLSQCFHQGSLRNFVSGDAQGLGFTQIVEFQLQVNAVSFDAFFNGSDVNSATFANEHFIAIFQLLQEAVISGEILF